MEMARIVLRRVRVFRLLAKPASAQLLRRFSTGRPQLVRLTASLP